MAIREQAKQWATDALKFDAAFTAKIHAYIDEMPLSLEGMAYCPACESVLCGACGHCHMLDVTPFTRPECPENDEDMGSDCVAWFQAHKAIHTVQHLNEESEDDIPFHDDIHTSEAYRRILESGGTLDDPTGPAF